MRYGTLIRGLRHPGLENSGVEMEDSLNEKMSADRNGEVRSIDEL